MPSPASMSRRSSRAQRSVTEFGSPDHIALKASGLYQTTTVQDRIKQWQAHGAASAPAPDAVSVRSVPYSAVSTSPETIRETSSRKEDEQQRRMDDSRHKKVWTTAEQLEASGRMRSQGTPPKRVISDEHWKAKRSTKKDASPVQQKYVYDESDVGTQEVRSKPGQSEKTIKQAKAEREERRRRRVEARSRKGQSVEVPAKEATMDRTQSTRRTSIRADEFDSMHQAYSDVVQDENTPMSGQRSPSDSNSMIRAEDDYDKPVKKSKYAETLGRPPPTYQDAQLNSKKGGFRNRTKEVLGIVDPVPVYSNRLPSIEAWLDEQPDPFVEHNPLRVRFEDDISDSSRPQRTKQRSSVPLRRHSQQRSDEVAEGSERRYSEPRTEGNAQDHTSTEQLDVSPSPNLKRRGARASRGVKPSSRNVASNLNPESQTAELAEDYSPVASQCDENTIRATPTRLSTIASVETLQEPSQNNEVHRNVEPDVVEGKVTSHEEMMSVLSKPSLRRSKRRKRSVRDKKSQPHIDTTKQILDSLAEDETKYSRELATLVDGVIPVLLQCVLSKSDAVAAAEFFTTSTNKDLSFSRPVIDMGIALERLKSLHNRFSVQDVDTLLSWCRTAHKAYSDYLKAWRLTLQDVVVNLAPLEGSDGENTDLMARDENGDIVNAEGETVDIAFLMKRPLVNIRHLGRALSCLEEEMPDHPTLPKIAEDYRELTAAAKTKHQQEKGRLEDEAAANIDATKCRDIRNMAPLPGVTIESKRRVRARDCFDMTLLHSTGQRLDCKVELILRDNQQPTASGGDLLICQIEENGKWLLFASIDLGSVSARKDEAVGSLVLMVRGRAGFGQEWHELLALRTDDLQAVSEWLIMLGSNPLPPKLNIEPSVDTEKTEAVTKETAQVTGLTKAALQRVPSIESVDVPIGEPSVLGIVDAKHELQDSVEVPIVPEKSTPQLNMGGGLQRKQVRYHLPEQSSHVTRKPLPQPVLTSNKSMMSGSSTESVSTIVQKEESPTKQPAHVQTKHDSQPKTLPEKSRYGPQHIPLPKHEPIPAPTTTTSSTPKEVKAPAKQSSGANNTEHVKNEARHRNDSGAVQQQAVEQTAPAVTPSATPNESLPKVGKVRGNSSSSIPLTDSIRETWSTISGFGRKAVSQPSSPVAVEKSEPKAKAQRPSSAHEQGQTKPITTTTKQAVETNSPPPPPQHKELPILTQRQRNIPTLGPSEAQIKMDKQRGRLSMSPLRKEYRPSSASGSENSGSESPYSSDDDSQTSEDLAADYSGKPLPKVSAASRQPRQSSYGPPPSVPTTGTRTLAPSDSASQGPYRRVPSSADRPDAVRKQAIAMICSWNDKGMWEPLVEDLCRIVVSPGLMEAFVMGDTQETNLQPLAAFELTPLVPLRKPTGLDISIRSPSTPDSRIQTSSNIMFRSRNAVDCEAFYHMINWARFNNPTYNKLARDRPQPQPTVTFSNQQPPPRPRSWFSFGGGLRRNNSYRVGNIPPSSMGESQATANTTSSAMSALRRLTKSSNFNVNRSSVVRRSGATRGGSLYSFSSGTGVDSQKSTPPPSQMGYVPGREGPNVPPTSDAALRGGGMVHNMKIRLQLRRRDEWVTIGFSRLTILPAVKHSGDSPQISRPGSSDSNTGDHETPSRRVSTLGGTGESQQRQPRLPSSSYTPHRLHGGGREKRIVITAEKDSENVLLDATLGESCFEMISRVGIAVQVWVAADEVRSRGGVGLGQNTMYLLQFTNAQECAWVFDLVGSYRYNN